MDSVQHPPLEALLLPMFLERSAVRFGGRTALSFEGRHWTYAQLQALVDRAAAGLQRLGLRKGDRVGLCLPNLPYYVIFHYAALKAGCVVVNYNPLYVERELRFQIEDSDTKIMIVPDLVSIYDKVARVEYLRKIVVCPFADVLPTVKGIAFSWLKRGLVARPAYDGRIIPYRQVIASGAAMAPVAIETSDIAVIQYTGGPTGQPTGAVLTHANISINAQQAINHVPHLREGAEKMLAVLPFFHVYGMTVILTVAMKIGADLIMHPRFEIGALLKSFARDKPTMFYGVPTIYAAIVMAAEKNPLDLSSLHLCLSGGAPLPAEIRERFLKITSRQIIESYGLTEASPSVCSNPPGGEIRADSVGVAVQGTVIEIRSLDESHRILPPGEMGEICVRGPQVMQGYLNRPEETANAFIDGALRTGDVGYLDADGYLFITDRIKDLILCGGYNVYPRAIEDALYEHPAIAEAVVIGIPDAYRGQAPLAFVTLRPGETRTGDELRNFLKDRISVIELPVRVEIRTSLPKTAIGKLSRKELADEIHATLPS